MPHRRGVFDHRAAEDEHQREDEHTIEDEDLKSCTTKGPAVVPHSRVRATFRTEMPHRRGVFDHRDQPHHRDHTDELPETTEDEHQREDEYTIEDEDLKSCTTKRPAVLPHSRVRATFRTELLADTAVIEQRLERSLDATGHCNIFLVLNRDWEPSGSTEGRREGEDNARGEA